MTDRARRVTLLLATAALTAVLGSLMVWMTGRSPAEGVAAFLRGAITTRTGLTESMVAATPLLLCGLSVAVSFRAGLFNIGAEGQLLTGMLGATVVGVHVPSVGFVGALVAGGLCGAGLAGIAGWFVFARRVPEVLATLLLNFIALHLVGYSVHGFLQEASGTLPQSDPIALAAWLPRLWTPTRLHLGVFIAFGFAVLIHRFLLGSAMGLRLRAAGIAPRAARVAGFPVRGDRWRAFLLSGFLAGLAGGVEVCGITHRLYENPSPGFGYLAIAVALLGGLRPLGVLGAALAFGVLDAGGGAMARNVGLSEGLTMVLFACAVLSFLALDPLSWRVGRGARG